MMMPGFGATEAPKIHLRHVRAGAGFALRLGMVDPLKFAAECSASQPGASSALTIVPGTMRGLIQCKAAASDRNTAKTLLLLRSRTMLTDLRLPFWFAAKRRSQRFSLWFAGFKYPPK